MQTISKIEPGIVQASAVAIGFFDGVHVGHQAVINSAVQDAVQFGVKSCIVTFKDHPRLITQGSSPELLTSLNQRLNLFAKMGVDLTLALPFTEQISHLSPQEYVQQILIGAVNARSVSIGYNHHFAHNRQGTPKLLEQLGKQYNFDVHITPEVFVDGVEASSSRIREALKNGDLPLVTKLLGRPYTVAGTVIHGQDHGRLTGFHTANLEVAEYQLIPCDGVYAAMVEYKNERRVSAVNIGCRPTLTNDRKPTIEVHILDFDQDLYGQDLEVELWKYIRPEQKFPGVDALTAQIAKDCLVVKEFFCESTTYN